MILDQRIWQEPILIFGGTTEGRLLFETLQREGCRVALSVATDYGRELAEDRQSEDNTDGMNHPIHVQRLSAAQMAALVVKNGYKLLIDATHPYADLVSAAIREASAMTKVPMFRLVRPVSEMAENTVVVPDVQAAVAYLSQTTGTILSTIGSKHLDALRQLPDFKDRVYVRLLPDSQAITACKAAGLSGRHLIAMQGPFSLELNLAMLRQFDCKFLLTKNSGEPGGFAEKLKAAQAAGVKLVVIERPTTEQGLSFEALIQMIGNRGVLVG